MPRSDIDRIREKIRLRQYDISAHAMEEMAEDLLTILDIEEAVLSGQLVRLEKGDPRGTKYVVVGTALDQQTPVGVVGQGKRTHILTLAKQSWVLKIQMLVVLEYWRKFEYSFLLAAIRG